MSKSYFLTFFATLMLLCSAALAFIEFEALKIGAMSPLEYLIRAGGPLLSSLILLIMARRARRSEGADNA